jgi:hypothetical protein
MNEWFINGRCNVLSGPLRLLDAYQANPSPVTWSMTWVLQVAQTLCCGRVWS